MNILLIEPGKARLTIGGEDVFLYEPLALEYLAAGVASHHDVRILDLRLEKRLPEVLAEYRPDVVGITSYTVHVNTVRGLFDDVKRWNPEVLTVVGGHHATVAPQDFVSPAIDLIVLGEGVFTFKEIVQRFERGEGHDGLAGLAFAKNGKLARTDGPPVTDLDVFPFPDRRFTARYRSRYYSEWMRPLASMRTSKGCPYRCKFCALWKLAGGRYLKRRPEKVVEELAGLDEEFVFFADDESLVDAARMKTLAERIRGAGIRKRYFLYGRSDTIASNPDLLALWRDVGLERVFVGLEFFRDQDLAYIEKGTTIADNQRAVQVLHDLGIEVYASFIVRPEFNRSDFTRLRQYCRDLDLNFATFAMLTPLPGTGFYEEVKSQLITQNYDLYDFIHTLLPTELPLKDFHDEYRRLVAGAIPLSKQLPSLKKYRWHEIAPLLFRFYRLLNRLRTAHLDYES
jgi:radical SAM superfamily enzyme YgiQ (UPF0313 family)